MTVNKQKLCKATQWILSPMIGGDYTAKDIALITDAFLGAVLDAMLRGDRIEIRNFGQFKPNIRKGGKFRDPRFGTEIVRGPKMRIRFTASKKLDEGINAAFRKTLKGFQEAGSTC